MSTEDKEISVCANCGKGEEESGNLKSCTACKMVKYCNRECQIAHRPQHKKECRKRAAELHDEKLFEQPPPREECPICLLPLPFKNYSSTFMTCCGKSICSGCIYAMINSEGGAGLCAFCRTPRASSSEEETKRTKILIDKSNAPATAFNYLAGDYAHDMPQDLQKANELWLKAGELGCSMAYHNLGNSYHDGRGVEVDMKKAKHYYELAAMLGSVISRCNLGGMEWQAGNRQRSMKHKIIAAKAGHEKALHDVTDAYKNEVGLVTKEEYANTLRAYHERQKEMKSDDRDTAREILIEKSDYRWV